MMRQHLLSSKYQKIFQRQKYIRVGAALILFFNGIMVLGIIFLVPSYLMLLLLEDEIERRVSTERTLLHVRDVDNLENTLNSVSALMNTFEKNEIQQHLFGATLLAISNAAPSQIKLHAIVFQQNQDGLFVVSLRGTAETREAVLNYESALAMRPEVRAVESPVSNVLIDRKTPFVFNITLNPQWYAY
jgi:hypothetical protein